MEINSWDPPGRKVPAFVLPCFSWPRCYSEFLPRNHFPGSVRDMRPREALWTAEMYGKNLHELDLPGLAELCGNVANNNSANQTQADTAHALRVEWVRLRRNHSPHDGKEAEASLKKRMTEFLVGVPGWMMSGT